MIDELRAATRAFESPFVEFADDNTFVNKKWGKTLLREMEPLNLRWFTETDISVADDPELLDLMANAGCKQILIGLESPSETGLLDLDPHNWKGKAVRQLPFCDFPHSSRRDQRQWHVRSGAGFPHDLCFRRIAGFCPHLKPS